MVVIFGHIKYRDIHKLVKTWSIGKELPFFALTAASFFAKM
jgi:hypothetical protein